MTDHPHAKLLEEAREALSGPLTLTWPQIERLHKIGTRLAATLETAPPSPPSAVAAEDAFEAWWKIEIGRRPEINGRKPSTRAGFLAGRASFPAHPAADAPPSEPWPKPVRVDLAVGALHVALKTDDADVRYGFTQSALDFLTGDYEDLDQ